MKKRLLSALLALVMAASLLPAGALPALAAVSGGTSTQTPSTSTATAVTYNRENPEVAIFNANSKLSQSLYDAAKTEYPQYNASKYFRSEEGFPCDYSAVSMGTTYHWKGTESNGSTLIPFKDTTLYALTQPYTNLKVNLSMTSQNYTHPHSKNKVLYTDVKNITKIGEVWLYLCGARTYVNGSMSESDVSSKPRIGDLTSDTENLTPLYHGNSYVGNDAYIQISSPDIDYELDGKKACTCSGAFVSNVMVTFVDDRAPVLENIEFSKDNGDSWVRHAFQQADLQVGKDETLLIRYTYDEPIRFSDDSAVGKESLYLSLGVDGKDNETYKANLTKLDGNSLYFSYTNDKSDIEVKINELNMGSLFSSEGTIPLNQVVGNTSFPVDSKYKIKDTNSTLGISTSTCWVTDLAGNPIPNYVSRNVSLRLDSKAPTVATGGVRFLVDTNNADVKAALGKTNMDPNDNGYTDASDTHLGVGDRIALRVTMSECLNIPQNTTAVATSNIKVSEGYVCGGFANWAEKDWPAQRNADGYLEFRLSSVAGPKQDEATLFYGRDFLITGDMVIEGDSKEIKITKLVINGETGAKDLAGNVYDNSGAALADNTHNNPPSLDVTPAAVTEIANSYSVYDTTGFRYGVTLSDSGSGFAGLNGTFILTNGTSDTTAYSYEYCVKAGLTATGGKDLSPKDGDWKTAILGEEVSFTQTAEVYIYIRPAAGVKYADLAKCKLTIKPRDYAGNVGSTVLPAGENGLPWYIDNLPPTVAVASSSRALKQDNSGDGTLTVNLTMSDTHGISSWQYGWSNSKNTQPTTWETGSGTSLTENVTSENAFSGHLWVKATDGAGTDGQGNSNNTSDAYYLGYFSYDITPVKYTLDYSPKVQSSATVKLTSLDSDGAVIFVIHDKVDGKDIIYYRMYTNGATADDIFTKGWARGTYTKDNGVHAFRGDATLSATLVENIRNKVYTGELSITMLSGKTAGVDQSGDNAMAEGVSVSIPYTAGNTEHTFSEETITLRVVGTDYEHLSGTEIKAAAGEDLGTPSQNENWNAEDTILSTLSGKAFTVNVGTDALGWDYANVDWSQSKVIVEKVTLVKQVNHYEQVASVPLTPRASTQTIHLPVMNYASGIYRVRLHIKAVAGKDYDVSFTPYIAVDATVPDNDFTLSSAIYEIQGDSNYTNAYGLLKQENGFYAAQRECLDGNTIILPISGDEQYLGKAQKYTLTFTSGADQLARTQEVVGPEGNEAEGYSSYLGQFYWAIWDTADPGKVIKRLSVDQTAAGAQNTWTLSSGSEFVFQTTTSPYVLYLEPNQTHTIAVQKVYANGTKSVVKEFQVKPVSSNLDGETTIDVEYGQLVFTPDETSKTANLSAGATVYAWAYQTENEKLSNQDNKPTGYHYAYGYGTPLTMALSADGKWRCDLPEGGAIYRVVTITADGCVKVVGDAGLRQLAPQIKNDFTFTDNDGAYNFVSNNTTIPDVYIYDEKPDELALTFAITDTAGVSQSLTLKVSDMEVKNNYPTYGTTVYKWVPKDPNMLGLWHVEVTVSKNNSLEYGEPYLCISQVKGNYLENSKTFTFTATDSADQSTSKTVDFTEKTASAPTITGELIAGGGTENFEGGLKLTFSQAVLPVESWAWDPNRQKVYSNEWIGAFPITKDGTYTVEYYDVYGRRQSQVVTLKDVFRLPNNNGQYFAAEMDVSFSEAEPTANDVTVTVSSKTNYFSINGGQTLEGEKNHTVTENGRVQVKLTGVAQYTLNIYVTNIVKGAPTAEVRYYVYSLGREFSETELEAYIQSLGGSLTVTGNVQVSYKAKTSVTATDGGTSFLFTPENSSMSHTFSFKDALGQTGSVTAKLPNGLALTAPTAEAADTTPPTVSVDIYGKRAGTYTARSSFRAGDTDIAEKFAEAGYVRAYSLTVNAEDPSGYDIAVSQADGVTLTGNIVEVTKAADFTITVTDRSANENATTISITADMVEKIDNTAPTATFSEQTTDTGKKVTITLSDNSGSVALTSPTNAQVDSTNPMVYTYEATQNCNLEFHFVDEAGNPATREYAVTGIDNSPPVATIHWSPSEGGTYNEETHRVEGGHLPSTKVNTSVTAVVEFDKPLKGIIVYYGEGFSNKMTILSQYTAASTGVLTDGENGEELVRFSASAQQVVITWLKNYGQFYIEGTAQNDQPVQCDFNAMNIIDKAPPSFTVTQTSLKRSEDYTVPYAYKVTLAPENNGETIYFPLYGATEPDGNGGRQAKGYTWADPLELTFTENGTYKVQAVDEAGNTSTTDVVITGIDRTAPEIKVANQVEVNNNQVQATITITDANTFTVTIQGYNGTVPAFTSGTAKTITFGDNGSYRITATDKAGNSSSQVVVVKGLDKLAPTISFKENTIYVLQDTSADTLNAQLGAGSYTVWDNKDTESQLDVQYAVKSAGPNSVSLETILSQAGQYSVEYTVKDKAGNETKATRIVQVIGPATVCAQIDSSLILPNRTAVLTPGLHTLTLKNCAEPYTIKARKGLYSLGQMKYLSGNSLTFGADGTFTVTASGYYTLLITTQSRQTIRILLYVEL